MQMQMHRESSWLSLSFLNKAPLRKAPQNTRHPSCNPTLSALLDVGHLELVQQRGL